MSNKFKEKVAMEFNREKNFSQIISKEERKMNMKIGYVLVPTCAVVLGVMGVVNYSHLKEKEIKVANNNQVIESVLSHDTIEVNQIENLAVAKLMAESKMIEKGELPEDIRYMADFKIKDGVYLNRITAVYTKSDYAKEEFDLLHDYVLLFLDESGETSVKISVSKEGSPLRDYFFEATEDMSQVNGKKVKISKYENQYIVNFSEGETYIDIETQGLTQVEVVELIQKTMK